MPLSFIDLSRRPNCLRSSSVRRQAYFLPSVRPGAEAEVGIIRILRRSASLKATEDSPEDSGPTMASTPSSCASLRAPTEACFGSPPVSKRMSSIGLPLMPPAALISATAMSAAVSAVSPVTLSGPAVTTMLPILIVSCAQAVPASSDNAAAPSRDL
jgi:hypothetical protein